jgi:hypothetical protein
MGWIVAGFIVAVLASGFALVMAMALSLRDLDDAYDWDEDW